MALAPEPSAVASEVFREDTARGRAGFFRVAQDAGGRWWLLDPGGAPFFARAVHGVCGPEPAGDGALPPDPAVRLRQWGFNAAGAGADSSGCRDDGLPFLAEVDFCAVAPVIHGPGVRLPDVFAPDWPQLAARRALEVCADLVDCREVLGWITDAHLAWAQPSLAGRPSLLQLCLSLEPGFAAYHAAWEFVLALHGGRLESVARAWGASLPNKEVVRELTRAEEGLGTRGYLRDDARWTRELARRYFTTTASAVRGADPNHLLFGCRFREPVGTNVLGQCVYPMVDVAMPDWRELPATAATPSEGEVTHPVLAGEVCWATPEFVKLPTAARVLRLTSVEWMLRRGRVALERLARHPAVVGYVWAQWQDEPGEQPPFARGLIHVNGVEAREHTELLAPFNRRAEDLRRAYGGAQTS